MSRASAAVLYEVTAVVDPAHVPAYEQYMLDIHIPDVLASGCFTGAAMVKSGDNRYRIVYELSDGDVLQTYLDAHAPALRADFARHFPQGVELSREIWHLMERWSV